MKKGYLRVKATGKRIIGRWETVPVIVSFETITVDDNGNMTPTYDGEDSVLWDCQEPQDPLLYADWDGNAMTAEECEFVQEGTE